MKVSSDAAAEQGPVELCVARQLDLEENRLAAAAAPRHLHVRRLQLQKGAKYVPRSRLLFICECISLTNTDNNTCEDA